MFKMNQNYRNKCRYFSRTNTLWTVLNKETMIIMIKKMKKGRKN